MIKRIIVGTDGSKTAQVAEDYGIYLSVKLKRPVIGVHVIDIRLLEGPFLEDIAGALGFSVYADLTPKIKEILEARAEAILNDFAKKCRERGGDCSITQIFGIVTNELVDMADEDDLIIVGKKGEHPEYIPLFLGSTAESVARKAKCPVMVTAEQFKEIQNITLAFDGREKSIHAAQYLNEFCKNLGINKIKVITVFEEKNTEKEKLIENLLKEYLKLDYDFVKLYGYPEEEIVIYLKEHEKEIDLLTIGAYGESKVKELILGSTTSYIMQKSEVPVLLVK